jgi:hypothetical protein
MLVCLQCSSLSPCGIITGTNVGYPPTTWKLFDFQGFSSKCKDSNVIVVTTFAIQFASTMFISLRFVAVVAVFAPFSCAATYFVDPNCDASYSGISQTSFPEAWDMARNALQVANSGNENEQFVYGKLFKEGVKETIKGVAGGVFVMGVHGLTVTVSILRDSRRTHACCKSRGRRLDFRLR